MKVLKVEIFCCVLASALHSLEASSKFSEFSDLSGFVIILSRKKIASYSIVLLKLSLVLVSVLPRSPHTHKTS